VPCFVLFFAHPDIVPRPIGRCSTALPQ
jgi:hypothetical protein